MADENPNGLQGPSTVNMHMMAVDETGKWVPVRMSENSLNMVDNRNIDLAGDRVLGTLPATKGGTGQNTYTTGDTLYASAANTLSKLAIGTSRKILMVQGSGVPGWSTRNIYSGATVGFNIDNTSDGVLYACTAGGSGFTITISAVSTFDVGHSFTIMKVDSGAGLITIDPNSSETINGATTNVLNAQYSYVTLISTGTGWAVLSANDWVQNRVTSNTNYPGASGAFGDITSISLGAGEWDLSGVVYTNNNGASISAFALGISSTSGNSATGLQVGDNRMQVPFPTAVSTETWAAIPAYKVSLTSTTTYYLKLAATYSVATPLQQGRLSARRTM